MAQWLPTVKFGSGKDGSPNSISGVVNTYATCTGTATETTLTTTLSASLGDVIFIHQTQGTGAGQWELNYVTADNGATLTLALPLSYTYTTGSQVVLVKQYTGGTISGSVIPNSWNGSTGGIVALMSNSDLTISGSINCSGYGFRGGSSNTSVKTPGQQGESSLGIGSIVSPQIDYGGQINNNGAAGGGGIGWWDLNGTAHLSSSGAGGAYSGDGTNGGGYNSSNQGSTGGWRGLSIGIADLTSILFGAGGGQGGKGDDNNQNPGAGGNGGGIIVIISKSITITGTISSNGANGGNSTTNDSGGGCCGAGGAGSGGAIIINSMSPILGSSRVVANGGIGGNGYGNIGAGGNGSTGRIRVNYYSSVSGTTSPTLSSSQDTNLKSFIYSGMI